MPRLAQREPAGLPGIGSSLRRPMSHSPFLVRLVAASITAQQNQMLLAEVALLRTENVYLREQLPDGHRFTFTDRWRSRFARAGAAVGWKRLGDLLTVAKARTVQRWHQLLRKGRLDGRRRGPGRPRIQAAIEALIVRLAKENPLWGQKRIAGMLALLCLAVSPRTIAAVLGRQGMKPAPERSADSTWRRFITDHLDVAVATDFFTVDVWTWLGRRTYDVLFAVHLGSRKAHILGVTEHSNAGYMVQTAREATMEETGWLARIGCRYLIHDRDTKFCGAWANVLHDAGIETVAIPASSPNCNAFAERWVRTVKRECIRRCWFLGYDGLRRVLGEFVDHYNTERPHQSLGNRPLTRSADPPAAAQKSVADFAPSQIRCVTRCDGAVRHYNRVAA